MQRRWESQNFYSVDIYDNVINITLFSSSKRSEEVACSALMNALLEDGENLSVSSRGGGNLSVSSRGGGNMSVSSRGRENLSVGSRERDNMSVSSRGRENKAVPNKNMLNNPQVVYKLFEFLLSICKYDTVVYTFR